MTLYTLHNKENGGKFKPVSFSNLEISNYKESENTNVSITTLNNWALSFYKYAKEKDLILLRNRDVGLFPKSEYINFFRIEDYR